MSGPKDRGGRGIADDEFPADVDLDAERATQMVDDSMLEETAEELRDFLAADTMEVPVDPAFKERLRRELWQLVQAEAAKKDDSA